MFAETGFWFVFSGCALKNSSFWQKHDGILVKLFCLSDQPYCLLLCEFYLKYWNCLATKAMWMLFPHTLFQSGARTIKIKKTASWRYSGFKLLFVGI